MQALCRSLAGLLMWAYIHRAPGFGGLVVLSIPHVIDRRGLMGKDLGRAAINIVTVQAQLNPFDRFESSRNVELTETSVHRVLVAIQWD